MDDTDDIEALAGEFVLGSLTDAERRDVMQRLAAGDVRLAAAIESWERRLGPLALRVPSVAPPANALGGLLAAISGQNLASASSSKTIVALRRDVQRWRRISGALAASSTFVALALAALSAHMMRSPGGDAVAVLSGRGGDPVADEPLAVGPPVFVAKTTALKRTIEVRQIAGRRPAGGRNYAAWLVAPGSATGVRLGILSPTAPSTTMTLPEGGPERLDRVEFVISLETSGAGSAAGPAGPIVARGVLEEQ